MVSFEKQDCLFVFFSNIGNWGRVVAHARAETFPREFLAIYCNSSPWPSVKQRRILMSSVVTRLVHHLCTDYDGVCAGAEDSLRLPNQIRNDATGRDFPWPYRFSYVASTRKTENFLNSAPCSTKAPAGYYLQYANLCGAGRGCP